jgi:hypothetical protein
MCQESVPESVIPQDISAYGFSNEQYMTLMIDLYYKAGESAKAAEMAARFSDSLLESAAFFMRYPDWAKDNFDLCYNCLAHLAGLTREHGHTEISDSIVRRFNEMF